MILQEHDSLFVNFFILLYIAGSVATLNSMKHRQVNTVDPRLSGYNRTGPWPDTCASEIAGNVNHHANRVYNVLFPVLLSIIVVFWPLQA